MNKNAIAFGKFLSFSRGIKGFPEEIIGLDMEAAKNKEEMICHRKWFAIAHTFLPTRNATTTRRQPPAWIARFINAA